MDDPGRTETVRSRIAKARAQRAAARQTLLKWVAGAVLLAVIGGAGIGVGFLLGRDAPPESTVAGPTALEPRALEPRGIEPIPSPADPGAEPVRAVQPPASESPPVEPPPAQATAAPASSQARFREALRDLDDALESGFAGTGPTPEHGAAREQIALLREKAVEAYNDGDADGALRLLADAARGTGEAVRAAQDRYQLALQAAKDAYGAADAAGARTYIAQALEQRPGDPEAGRWEDRIAKLPELLGERRKAENARSAGKLREEQAALRRIIELDPEDADAGPRVEALGRELREREFNQTIAQGRKAVDAKTLAPAKQALAQARRQKPGHADTRQLAELVAALERTQTHARHLAAAQRAATQDDWQAALAAFDQASALKPTHADTMQGKDLAARIVSAQRSTDGFLARPARLSSPNIAAAARETLREATPLAALSPRLKESGDALKRAIEAGQTPVPVRVVSDNRTEIEVRGIGKVGRTEDRIIELRPGTYLFEGKCAGFRSKLIEVTVQGGGAAPAEVRIVCDERS